MKSSEVSIKTRSTPASLTIQGQVTKDTTVKWSIGSSEACNHMSVKCLLPCHLDQTAIVYTLFYIRTPNLGWGLRLNFLITFGNLSLKCS